jgi:hypothetical protein
LPWNGEEFYEKKLRQQTKDGDMQNLFNYTTLSTRLEKTTRTLFVTLNRPEGANALDLTMGRDLLAAALRVEADAAARAVVVTGAGRRVGRAIARDLAAVLRLVCHRELDGDALPRHVQFLGDEHRPGQYRVSRLIASGFRNMRARLDGSASCPDHR